MAQDSSATSLSSLQIRPATPADLPRILEVIAEAFEGVTFHHWLEQRYGVLGGQSWRERKASEVEAAYHRHPEWVHVATIDDAIVGVVTFTLDTQRLIGQIGNNGVDPAFRGRGIGTRMYNYALDHFREAGMRYAEVVTGAGDEAAPARRSYEKVGFQPATYSVRYFREL